MSDIVDPSLAPDILEFPCLKIKQPIGEFYVGILDADDLIYISRSDVVSISGDRRELEVLSGIERPLSQKRAKEIGQYTTTLDATFPTGVILAISSEDVISFDEIKNRLKIRRREDVAKILDGQHRIEGLRLGRTDRDEGQPFQVTVTFFVDIESEDQALIFSTINLKQEKVAPSIVYELFEYARRRSPQKTCHTIARVFNAKPGNPFFGRIMILGSARHKEEETITQAAFIKPLLALISSNPISDRDLLRRGKRIPMPDDPTVRVKKLVFRRWFIDEKDAYIAKTMDNYFSAVRDRWPEAWDEKGRGKILHRTTGYNALMRLLPLVLIGLQLTEPPAKELFNELFAKVRLNSEDFNPDTFKPGSSGEGELFRRLCRDSGFDPSSPWRGMKVEN